VPHSRKLLAGAIGGARCDQVLAPRTTTYRLDIAAIVAGSWRAKRRAEIASSGYVLHTLEAALWYVARTTSFRDAVVLATDLGDDADTVAAGQLTGALWGASSPPADWLSRAGMATRDRQIAAEMARAVDRAARNRRAIGGFLDPAGDDAAAALLRSAQRKSDHDHGQRQRDGPVGQQDQTLSHYPSFNRKRSAHR
jgi:hypothetical protein